MPPKDAKKTKTEPKKTPVKPKAPVKAATPEEIEVKPKAKLETPKTPKTARKAKPVEHQAVFQLLPKSEDQEEPLPVAVGVDGGNSRAVGSKSGTYRLLLQLSAPSEFELTKTILLSDGPYAGQQAILLMPAKPFDFMGMADVARNRVYQIYFASHGSTDGVIALEGKRSSNKEMYAKAYAGGDKNRAALLAVSKKINAEATAILYDHPIRLDSTAHVIDFFSEIPAMTAAHMLNIEIKTWTKTTARNALHMLSAAIHLKRLRLEQIVVTEDDPAKAAAAFYKDAYKFLEAVGAGRSDKTAGVDILEFGKSALQMKDSGGTPKGYSEEMVQKFKSELKKKLK